MIIQISTKGGKEVYPKESESKLEYLARGMSDKIMKQVQPDASGRYQLLEALWADYRKRSTEAEDCPYRSDVMKSIFDEMYGTQTLDVYESSNKEADPTSPMVQVTKSRPDQQLVFGWANVSKTAEGQYPLDWDGDQTDPQELEKAAYTFVLKHRVTGERHQGGVKGYLVESMMFTKEKKQALGLPENSLPDGWWVGFHIPDKEVFDKVKNGEYQMFSVQGKGLREPILGGDG